MSEEYFLDTQRGVTAIGELGPGAQASGHWLGMANGYSQFDERPARQGRVLNSKQESDQLRPHARAYQRNQF